MTQLQVFFLGCMVALTPCLAALAFVLWRRQNSSRLRVEDQPDLLEDQLAIDLRALIPIIVKDTHTLSEAETAARHHLIRACRTVLAACGYNVLHTGTVSPPLPSIDNGK